ncbi:MAG: hypothetical protein MPJ22_04190 [Pirellulales bacterium]|nr:hypothetical protein [Pirellulales bacterium]
MIIALLYAATLYGIYRITKVPKWLGIVSVVILSVFTGGGMWAGIPEGTTILWGGAMCAVYIAFEKRSHQKVKDEKTVQ